MHIILTGNTSFKIANFRAGLIKALISDGHILSVLAPRDEYSNVLQDMGCRIIPLYMDRNGTNPVSEARLLLSIYRALGRLRPDLVLSYTIKNNIYAGLVCNRLGIPFVPNVTGLGPAFTKDSIVSFLVRLLYRRAFRNARKVFFQNAEDRDFFLRAGLVTESKTQLLPGSGVNLMEFAFVPLPEYTKKIRFLLVARMLKDKGVCLFVEAARLVRAQYPYAQFQLLGPLDPDSKTGITKSEIDGWVSEGVIEYLGSTFDVRPRLRESHCVVLPSYYKEGTPRSLLEAAAIGRPVITTDLPGCRDTLTPGISGFMVQPQNVTELANALLKFMELSEEERQGMGRESRRLAEHKFDEKIIIQNYRNLIRN